MPKTCLPLNRGTHLKRNEGGIGSAKRVYLRVVRGKLTFDVCAAPHGRDFFFSWWLAVQPPQNTLLFGCLGSIAILGALAIALSTFGLTVGLIVFGIAVGAAWTLIASAIQNGMDGLEDIILAVPIWGGLYSRWLKPPTYYATDTRLMFQDAVHRAVLETIDGVRTAKGLRALSPEESRPTMRDVLS